MLVFKAPSCRGAQKIRDEGGIDGFSAAQVDRRCNRRRAGSLGAARADAMQDLVAQDLAAQTGEIFVRGRRNHREARRRARADADDRRQEAVRRRPYEQ